MPVRFRLSNARDIDRIMDVLADGRRSLAALGIDQWQGGYPHRGAIEADVARGDSYVVEDSAGTLAATAMIGFAGEPDYDVIKGGSWLSAGTSANPCYGMVHRLAVLESYKGKGAGALILSHAERLARACGRSSVRIDTHPGNAPMRRLLTKCGYDECGVILISHAEEATPVRIAYEKMV